MSLVYEQVNKLRELADAVKKHEEYTEEIDGYIGGIFIGAVVLEQAADTIETLSAKVAAANMERSERYYSGGWIACSERLPEKIETDIFDMQLVTLDNGDVCLGVYRHDDKEWLTRMSEGETLYTNEHKVIAWQPLPRPYKENRS